MPAEWMYTMAALQFTYEPEVWEDSPPSRHWFAGRYKITAYDALDTAEYTRKEQFGAYYKPDGWKNWGMGVEPKYLFPTLEAAQAACERHAATGDYTYRETFRRTAC